MNSISDGMDSLRAKSVRKNTAPLSTHTKMRSSSASRYFSETMSASSWMRFCSSSSEMRMASTSSP